MSLHTPVLSVLHQVPAHLQLALRTSSPGSSCACFHKIQCFCKHCWLLIFFFFCREDSHLFCSLIFRNFSFLTYTSRSTNASSLWSSLLISQAWVFGSHTHQHGRWENATVGPYHVGCAGSCYRTPGASCQVTDWMRRPRFLFVLQSLLFTHQFLIFEKVIWDTVIWR